MCKKWLMLYQRAMITQLTSKPTIKDRVPIPITRASSRRRRMMKKLLRLIRRPKSWMIMLWLLNKKLPRVAKLAQQRQFLHLRPWSHLFRSQKNPWSELKKSTTTMITSKKRPNLALWWDQITKLLLLQTSLSPPILKESLKKHSNLPKRSNPHPNKSWLSQLDKSQPKYSGSDP